MFNALHINPNFLLKQKRSEDVIAATSLCIAAFGANEGKLLYRSHFMDFYESILGTVKTENHMKQAMQVWLHTLERIAPHKILISEAKVNEDELREFRCQHGRWRVGRAAAFYSYSIGTTLYFSDLSEALMAKFVLDTPTRQRSTRGGWIVAGTTSLSMRNHSTPGIVISPV